MLPGVTLFSLFLCLPIPMTSNSSLGKTGEDFACAYLVKNGFRVLERNYRTKWDELDVIAQYRDGTLVFVEVKTLMFQDGGLMPEDNMSPAKFSKISRACRQYAAEHEDLIREDRGWRIDLIAIDMLEDGSHKIRHYKNIS